jgi:hypothetical protein
MDKFMRTKFDIYVFIPYHCVDTLAGLKCIIHPVVSASALAWLIRYVFLYLQFLNHIIITKAKVLLSYA